MGAGGRRGGRPTLEMVAERAGVGRGTVSRVINGALHVSPQARAAVEEAIAELGYVPNRAARALAADRTDAIALVIPEPETRLSAEPFFLDVLRGVSAELADTDMQLLLMLIRPPRSGAGRPSTWRPGGSTACCWCRCTRALRCPTCWNGCGCRRC